MKLSRVWLDFTFEHPLLEGTRSELSLDDCSQMGAAGMRFDPTTFSLVIGENIKGIGWGHVIHWDGLNMQATCDGCEESFKTSQALGNHRRFCKGKKETAA